MSDANFEQFMRRVGAEDADAPVPDSAGHEACSTSASIWWRAELRRRIADQSRVTRPFRIAERAACVLCVAAAAVVGARMGVAGAAPFVVVSLVAGAGAAAFVLRGASE